MSHHHLWQQLAKHGLQQIGTDQEARARMHEVERGLAGLCEEIAIAAGRSGKTGIECARSLRATPESGGKSLYECLNQLIHYWYCCAAAAHLSDLGCNEIWIRPTAEDSSSPDNDAFDIVAIHPNGTVHAEVFCVSPWRKKMSDTVAKLSAPSSALYRLIYYNQDVKENYKAKKPGLYFLGITSPSGIASLICSTAMQPLPKRPIDGVIS